MPAQTERQRKAAMVALHSPEKLYKRNRGLAEMSKEQLEHYKHRNSETNSHRKGNPGVSEKKKKRTIKEMLDEMTVKAYDKAKKYLQGKTDISLKKGAEIKKRQEEYKKQGVEGHGGRKLTIR